MTFNRVKQFCLGLFLLMCFIGGGTAVVFADGDAERGKKIASRKGCWDLDRNASTDEEKTRGDCGGTTPTPEPVSIILFSAGLAGVGFVARRRLRKSE